MSEPRKRARKKVSGTAVFTVIAIALAAYVYVFEFLKKNESEEKKQSDAKIFSAIDQQKVSSITVASNLINREQDIKLEKKENLWRVVSPINDLADNDAVETYLATLLEEKTQESLGEQSPESLKTFGLDHPKGGVTLKTDELEAQVNIGSVKAYDGSLYSTISNKPGVFLVSAVWDALVSKKANEFRSKRLERSKFDGWNRVVTKAQGKLSVELRKADDIWELVPKSEIPVDSNLVAGFIQQMSLLEIQDFVSETKTDLGKFGLAAPDFEMSMSGEKESKIIDYKLLLSKKSRDSNNELASATSSDLSGVVKVHAAILGVVSRPREYFYSRKFPFQFDPTLAKTIRIKTPELSRELKNEKVAELAAAISRLEASSYLSESGSGLSPAKNKIEVLDEQGKLLIHVLWGAEYKPKTLDPANVGIQYYYAKTSKIPQTLSLKQNLVHELGLAEIFNEPAKATPVPSPTKEAHP